MKNTHCTALFYCLQNQKYAFTAKFNSRQSGERGHIGLNYMYPVIGPTCAVPRVFDLTNRVNHGEVCPAGPPRWQRRRAGIAP